MCDELEAPGLGGLEPPPAFSAGAAGAVINFSFKLLEVLILPKEIIKHHAV